MTRATPAKVLFVAYGSGHVKMVVPLAQALAASGRAEPVVLALTTAAPVARAAGLTVIQFKDFVTSGDGAALQRGERLMQGQDVKLSGFGNFQVRTKASRPGRNPRTGEEIPIEARCVVTFHASGKLKEQIQAADVPPQSVADA